MAVTGIHLGGQLAKALGLPSETTDILINIGLDEPISVLCRYYPSEEAMRAAMAIMTQYRLVASEEEVATDAFAPEQRQRLFRQSLLRGEAGIESPYLKRYMARKKALAAWTRLANDLVAINLRSSASQVDLTMIKQEIALLQDQIARMEAGEAV